MQRIQLQPVYVLHQRAWRNTSLLLEVFSRDFGRLGLIANGARRGPRAYLLQPFRALEMSWQLRDDLGRMTGVEPRSAVGLQARGGALICGFYLNELIVRLCHRHDPQPALFKAYQRALGELGAEQDEPALRRFELRLLTELGYGLQLEHSAEDGEPVHAEQHYDYQPEHGAMQSVGSQPPTGSVRISGRSLLALARDDYSDPQTLLHARRLTRACLQPLLGPRPLRSRALYAAMLNARPGAASRERE